MVKKWIMMLVLVVTAITMTGCPFIVSRDHTRAHNKALKYNMKELHQFVDRHFWLYDWEDPYVN